MPQVYHSYPLPSDEPIASTSSAVQLSGKLGIFARSPKKVQSTIYHAFASIIREYTLKTTGIGLIYNHSFYKEGPRPLDHRIIVSLPGKFELY